MVYGGAFHHTIYGVSVMQSNSAKERLPGYGCRSGNVLLLMFLTGIVLGCAATQLLGLRIRLPAETGAKYGLLDSGFLIVLLRNAKFLLCVFLLAFSHCMAAILRGAGKSTVPMLVMLLTWCAARVTFITLVVKLVNSIQVVFWAYPLTWLMSSVIFFYYYRKVDWMHAFDNQ